MFRTKLCWKVMGRPRASTTRRPTVALPGIGAVGWPLAGRPSSTDLFYTYASFLSPDTVYRYDLRNRESSPFQVPRVRFAREQYETRQVWFESKDGTRVPMFITAAKDLELDGSVFGSNHASNWLALAGNLPKDRERLLAALDEVLAHPGRARFKPSWMRGL